MTSVQPSSLSSRGSTPLLRVNGQFLPSTTAPFLSGTVSAPRHCGFCHQPGHTVRTCTKEGKDEFLRNRPSRSHQQTQSSMPKNNLIDNVAIETIASVSDVIPPANTSIIHVRVTILYCFYRIYFFSR